MLVPGLSLTINKVIFWDFDESTLPKLSLFTDFSTELSFNKTLSLSETETSSEVELSNANE